MLLAIETAIIDRLKARLPAEIRVEQFPDDPSTFQLLGNCAVLVHYAGSDDRDPDRAGPMAQEEQLDWDIHVVTRNLRGNAGIYQVLSTVRKALLGYRPAGASKMWKQSTDFTRQKSGIWDYTMTMSCTVMNVEQDEEADEPLITRIAAESCYGESIAEKEDE